jgi:hypothetical protein
LKRLQYESEALAVEQKLGMQLGRLNSGKVRMPQIRTEAQNAHVANLVKANRARALAKRRSHLSKEAVEESVFKVIKEVVNTPKAELERRQSFAPVAPIVPELTIEQRYQRLLG